MNSYISTPSPRADQSTEPAGYVSTGRPAATPTGYVSPDSRRDVGSYVSTEWVTAA
jgi:hypothetical protein